ncbi:MAG: sugar phosphate isomerase/epimerase [Ruminococcaceae bacterium]|nr:sugar phosphate isomerase/epimerase [Oscillospiraceae bacterium]
MKIAVSTYSLGDYLNPEKLGFCKCMEWAKEQGFEGVEVVEGSLNSYGITVEEVKEVCQSLDFPVVAYLVGADFLKNRGDCVEEVIDDLKKAVDKAAYLGAPMLRHDITSCDLGRKYGIGLDDVLPTLADACRRVTEYAEERGVKTMFENHGHFLQEAALCEKLINAVGHKNFGYTLDIGNFLCADQDPSYSVGKMARYAFHVHAKDFHVKPGGFDFPGEGWFCSRGNNFLRGAIIGHGDVNVARSIGALKIHGYDGWISIEFEGIEDNLKGIRIGFQNLKKYIG